MKKHCAIILVISVLLPFALLFARGTTEVATEKPQELVVYAYDSFVSEWGPGPDIASMFFQKTGIKVHLISAGSGGELLTRVALEQHNPRADVVVGVSHELLSNVKASGLFFPYQSPALKTINKEVIFDESYALLPFNYGAYAFVYDAHMLTQVPQTLKDLTDPLYRRRIILMDPRTSSVGKGLLAWTISVFGDDYLSWWEALKPNILTIADSWSSGYGLFTEGEAPLVISYTTSPVYHVMYEKTDRFQALVFNEGNYVTIEGVGILQSSTKKEEAKMFVDFLLTEAQSVVATKNIMYPVQETTLLPEAFDFIPKPQRLLSLPAEYIEQNQSTWLTEWTKVMSK